MTVHFQDKLPLKCHEPTHIAMKKIVILFLTILVSEKATSQSNTRISVVSAVGKPIVSGDSILYLSYIAGDTVLVSNKDINWTYSIGDTFGITPCHKGPAPSEKMASQSGIVYGVGNVKEGDIVEIIKYGIAFGVRNIYTGDLIIDTVYIPVKGFVKTYSVGDTCGFTARGPMVVWFPDLTKKIRNSPKGIVKRVLFNVKEGDAVKMVAYVTNSGKRDNDTCYWGVYNYSMSYAAGDTIGSFNRHGPWLNGYPSVVLKVFGGPASEKYLIQCGPKEERDPEIIYCRDYPGMQRYAVGDSLGGIRRGMKRMDSNGKPLNLPDEEDNDD
jgi:hypothetical protein